MQVSMIELMKDAKKKGYCVPAPAIENEHSIRACIEAAEQTKSPIIMIALYKVNPDIVGLGRIAYEMSMKASVPIAMCQDHGGTYEEAIWAIRAGFTDVMVDRSMLSFDDNVQQVKEIVKIAHAVGVGVEAELGHVGMADDADVGDEKHFTDPKQAQEFVKMTDVDALAVAIGTAHGSYKNKLPEIQFDLLKQLSETVPVPLVLHGASGSGDDNLRKASKGGICKLNISNDLKKSAIVSLTEQEDLLGMGAYRMYGKLAEGYKKSLLHHIDLCGSANRA